MNTRLNIQRTLIQTVRDGTYYEVKYEKGTNLPILLDEETPPPVITPASVRCNELERQFQIDGNYGRGLKSKSVSWVFQVHAEFANKEVTDEVFLKTLTDNVPTLDGLIVELIQTTYEHPVQQQASTGTKAIYTFRVSDPH